MSASRKESFGSPSVFLPASITPQPIALAGVAGTLLAVGLIQLTHVGPMLATLVLLGATAAPMWCLELRRFSGHRRPLGRPNEKRKALRVAGLVALCALFTLTLSLFRSTPARPVVDNMLLPLLAAAAAWMGWILLRSPSRGLDSVERVGLALLRGLRARRRPGDLQAFLGWLVKAFYLPLMAGSCYVFLATFREPLSSATGFALLFALAYQLLFAVDTAFATVGYMSTSRRIQAHIRRAEPTLLGWCAALVCYPPFNLVVLHQWLAYRDGFEWNDWMAGSPWLAAAWGSACLLSMAIYVWATVSFGLRFSNLTHRGIITSGPYRYTKHPSYLAKNAAWWLISIPFVSPLGWQAALANSLALAAIGGIYWVRAKSEERMLMKDPVYRAYAGWITEHGAWARLRRFTARG